MKEMAGRNTNTAYDFERFEPARKPAQQPQAVPQEPKIVPEKKKSKQQLQREAKARSRKVRRVILAAAVSLTMAGSLIHMRVQVSQITRDMSQAQRTLNEQRSEYTRLKMQLSASVSLDKVEKKATEELGMIKHREAYRYITMASEDTVVLY